MHILTKSGKNRYLNTFHDDIARPHDICPGSNVQGQKLYSISMQSLHADKDCLYIHGEKLGSSAPYSIVEYWLQVAFWRTSGGRCTETSMQQALGCGPTCCNCTTIVYTHNLCW